MSNQNTQTCQTTVPNPDCYRNTHINVGVSDEALASYVDNPAVETVTEHGGAGDKYCLELQTKMKGEKVCIAKSAMANKKFMAQNTPLFGFIPIYGLKGRVYDRRKNNICQKITELHQKLRKDGRHNYVGLQIPVPSKLNAEKWASYLTGYWDWQLLLLVKYGFPIDFNRNKNICHTLGNHNSADQYPEHVSHYVQEEIQHGAIAGPFKVPSIPKLHVSPFMTQDKSSSDHRRVIIDLGWPIGQSVNARVSSDKYLDTEFILTYPSIDNITDEVLKLGKGCHIFKVDISRAFRHVPMDPGDLDLLGLHWEGYFLD